MVDRILASHPLPPSVAARLLDCPLAMDPPALAAILTSTALRAYSDGQTPPTRQAYYEIDRGVAVIPVAGTLMKRGTGDPWLDDWLGLCTVESLRHTFTAALADMAARALLFQIDSPGGGVEGIFDLGDAVFAARNPRGKPIWAHADECATSAAYLLASACDTVRTTQVGRLAGIGVFAVRIDATGYDEKLGVAYHVIASGARKADFYQHKGVTEAELTALQKRIDLVAGIFFEAVARNRALSARVIAAMDAAIFSGDDAETVGLADGVATFDETLTELAEIVRSSTAPGSSTGRGAMSQEHDPTKVINLDDHRRELGAASATAAAEERKKTSRILALCTLAGQPAKAREFLEAGKSVEDVETWALAEQARPAAGATDGREPAPGAPAAAAGGDPEQSPIVKRCRELAAEDEARIKARASA